jgi:hypothetical protein
VEESLVYLKDYWLIPTQRTSRVQHLRGFAVEQKPGSGFADGEDVEDVEDVEASFALSGSRCWLCLSGPQKGSLRQVQIAVFQKPEAGRFHVHLDLVS